MSITIIPTRETNKFVRYCDFCAASEGEAKLLIASPNGNHICDECSDVCVEVVASERKEPRP